jgi:ribose-phosphate pyrophosphokinase
MKKDRNERTGEVRGIEIMSGKPKKNCIFLDDLCDGGATFKHGAAALRKDPEVENVGLIVAHGIFSKGLQIPGINFLATTNSFAGWESERLSGETKGIHVFKFV